MSIKYVEGKFIETGIKVTLEGDLTWAWIQEFKNATVSNVSWDCQGDYILLDLKKAEIGNNFLIQRMSIRDAKRLKDEFIRRVKCAIDLANLAIEKSEREQENSRKEREKKEKELRAEIDTLNKDKF